MALPRSPLVVLVPGLGLDGREWAAVRALLPSSSVVVTLPALGRAARRGTALDASRQAERVLALVPTGREVVLVGHSAGCPVAVEVAASRAGVLGLVLVGPVTDPRAATWPRMLGQWARTALHETAREVPVLGPQYARTGLASMLRGMDAVRAYRTDSTVHVLPLPVEVVRGERDRIAPADWCATLAGEHVTEVAGAAHMVPITHPRAVAEAVGRVLVRAAACGPGAG